MAGGAPEADGAILAHSELGDRAVAPEVRAGGHAERGMHGWMREMANAKHELPHNACFPHELRRVVEVLPLETAGLAQCRVAWGDAVGRRAQNLYERCARIRAAITHQARTD